jgi:hypothetical protein
MPHGLFKPNSNNSSTSALLATILLTGLSLAEAQQGEDRSGGAIFFGITAAVVGLFAGCCYMISRYTNRGNPPEQGRPPV